MGWLQCYLKKQSEAKAVNTLHEVATTIDFIIFWNIPNAFLYMLHQYTLSQG